MKKKDIENSLLETKIPMDPKKKEQKKSLKG